jgi:hypothetical protein
MVYAMKQIMKTVGAVSSAHHCWPVATVTLLLKLLVVR